MTTISQEKLIQLPTEIGIPIPRRAYQGSPIGQKVYNYLNKVPPPTEDGKKKFITVTPDMFPKEDYDLATERGVQAAYAVLNGAIARYKKDFIESNPGKDPAIFTIKTVKNTNKQFVSFMIIRKF